MHCCLVLHTLCNWTLVPVHTQDSYPRQTPMFITSGCAPPALRPRPPRPCPPNEEALYGTGTAVAREMVEVSKRVSLAHAAPTLSVRAHSMLPTCEAACVHASNSGTLLALVHWCLLGGNWYPSSMGSRGRSPTSEVLHQPSICIEAGYLCNRCYCRSHCCTCSN